jgi:hypothetical protein
MAEIQRAAIGSTKPLELQFTSLLNINEHMNFLVGSRRDQDLAGAGSAFESCREVHGAADGGELRAFL